VEDLSFPCSFLSQRTLIQFWICEGWRIAIPADGEWYKNLFTTVTTRHHSSPLSPLSPLHHCHHCHHCTTVHCHHCHLSPVTMVTAVTLVTLAVTVLGDSAWWHDSSGAQLVTFDRSDSGVTPVTPVITITTVTSAINYVCVCWLTKANSVRYSSWQPPSPKPVTLPVTAPSLTLGWMWCVLSTDGISLNHMLAVVTVVKAVSGDSGDSGAVVQWWQWWQW
jgi:hypothetical protein